MEKPILSVSDRPSIVFFGNERIATGVTTDAPVLRALLQAGYQVFAVVANDSDEHGPKQRELEIAAVAKAHDVPVLLPARLTEIADRLSTYRADVAVLVAYGKMVPESIINLFPHGIVNVHPSLLPKHRGPTPVESVLLNGEQTTGVSLMKLVKAMDAGPIYAQAECEVGPDETKQQLADNLLDIAQTMLIELLPGIIAGDVVPKPQDDTAATYDRLITKQDEVLDFTKSASTLEREIRAYQQWPKSRVKLSDIDVIITKAHAADFTGPAPVGHIETDGSKGILTIQTADGRLTIDRLKPAGKGEMSAAEFLRGYGTRLGRQ